MIIRVTVYMNGKAQFYQPFDVEELADRYARRMRMLYHNTGLSIFVKKSFCRA